MGSSFFLQSVYLKKGHSRGGLCTLLSCLGSQALPMSSVRLPNPKPQLKSLYTSLLGEGGVIFSFLGGRYSIYDLFTHRSGCLLLALCSWMLFSLLVSIPLTKLRTYHTTAIWEGNTKSLQTRLDRGSALSTCRSVWQNSSTLFPQQ